MRKERRLRALVAVGFALSVVATAQAQVNGGFETGDLTGWTASGDVSVQDAGMGTTPYAGNHQALMATATDDVPPVPAGVGVTGAAMLVSLGMQPGSLLADHGTPLLASGIAQSIHLQAGDTLHFAWDFQTNQVYAGGDPDSSYAPDPNNPDYAFFAVSTSTATSLVMLDDVFDGYAVDPGAASGFDTAFTITGLPNQFVSETGYRTFNMLLNQSEDATVSFGVVHSVLNDLDNGINSALLVDDFKVTTVPEPMSCAALFGLAGAAIARARKKS